MASEPVILGFDTSAAQCAAALLVGNKIVAQTAVPMARGQAEALMPILEETVSSVGFSALSAIAVCVGPGNFTGVRLAVATARGLSMSLGVPAHGVSSLEAAVFGIDGPVLSLQDAKRGKVNAQFFENGRSTGPELTDLEELRGRNWPADTRALGFGAEETGLPVIGADAFPDPQTLCRIAQARPAYDVPPPAPLYIRAADAALPSEKPPVILDDA